ncbi:VWA domain-containing protein [Nocardioides marmoraquaticus]
MPLVERHVGFLRALRDAGLPVSTAEGLDAVRAVGSLGLADREVLRAAYAATVVKRASHRRPFDDLFDLWWPALVGDGAHPLPEDDPSVPEEGEERARHPLPEEREERARHPLPEEREERARHPLPEEREERARHEGATTPADGPEELARLRDEVAEALADDADLEPLAREAVRRFGRLRGRGPGEQRWSAYTAMNRVGADDLVARLLSGLAERGDDDPATRRLLEQRGRRFEELVEADVRRRSAEQRGPEHVARHSVRPGVDQVDLSSASRAELELVRREVAPLARRLATRLRREQRRRRRGPLDVRRTLRAATGTGGVPLDTFHRSKRPGRPELVVLCDVSGSVAGFAGFTLMLVFALREQFERVRAFTFVDDVHEVTGEFTPGADPVEVLERLAASARHASRFGRTQYGRALRRFVEDHPDAVGPRTHLLVLGDARSNHGDLGLPVLAGLVRDARRAFWLNPEHARHWGTGDSGAPDYARLLPMVECRNLTQLGEFVHDLA